jgi:hypothetical protein
MMQELWIGLETDGTIDHFLLQWLRSPWLSLEILNGEPYLKITGTDVPQDFSAAEEFAKRTLFNVNAMAKCRVGYSGTLPRCKAFYLIDENKQRHEPGLSAKIETHTRVSAVLGDLADEQTLIAECLTLGNTDVDVCQALRFFAYEANWVNLYKVYEIVAKDLGGRAWIVTNGWWTTTELETFRQSSNDYRVSGDAARHARDHGEPTPQQRISTEEGVEYVRRLLNCWLSRKSKP